MDLNHPITKIIVRFRFLLLSQINKSRKIDAKLKKCEFFFIKDKKKTHLVYLAKARVSLLLIRYSRGLFISQSFGHMSVRIRAQKSMCTGFPDPKNS